MPTDLDFHAIDLAELSDSEILELARSIAHNKRQEIAHLSVQEHSNYADRVHDFGISLDGLKGSTHQGRLLRLSDTDFWSRKLRGIADAKREHDAAMAGVLGKRSDGLQPFCTDNSFHRFITRRSYGETPRTASSYSEILRETYKDAGELYRIVKALAERSYAEDFISLLMTLTCPAIYHSDSSSYKGYSAAQANEYLLGIFSKLIKSLSKNGKAGLDFCGVRVVELHENGCPHWHVVLYVKKSIEHIVHKKLKRIYDKDDERPKGYFDSYSSKIVSRKTTNDPHWFAAISYAFKSAFSWKTGRIDLMDSSLRQKAALSLAGIRQFQTIGSCGRVTKIRELEKTERKTHKSRHSTGPTLDGNSASQSINLAKMERTIALVSGLADEYKLEMTPHVTKYGENRQKICGISREIAKYNDKNHDRQARPNYSKGGVTYNYSRNGYSELSPTQERRESAMARYIRGVHDPPRPLIAARDDGDRAL